MVDLVEQATLLVRDRSTQPIRQINREVRNLRTEARRLDGIRVRLVGVPQAVQQANRLAAAIRRIPKSKTSNVAVKATGIAATRQAIERVSRKRSATVETKLTNGAAVSRRLDQIARNRTANIQASVTGGGVPGGGFPAAGAGGDGTIGDGIRDALRPRQIGRDIARGFTFSIQGELFQITRAIVREVAGAPVALDDALARARISGRTDNEIAFLRDVAERGSARFQAATEADIIANSAEVIGRFEDLSDPAQQSAAEQAILRLAANIQILDQALANGGTGGAGNQARLVETAIQQLGAAQDPVRADEISRAVLQAIIASGGDLQASDVKRTLQQLPTGRSAISADTLTQVLLVRDEGGRRSTGNFDQLLSDLIRGNLNDADTARQLASGARNRDGSSDLFDAFTDDFLGAVRGDILPRLARAGIEVSRENAGQIRAFLDNELGLSKQGGITFLSDAIINLAESTAEFNRAQRVTPDVAIEDPTIRQELRAVRAQFANVSAAALEPLIPAVKGSLDTISNALSEVQSGERPAATAAVAIGAAAIPVAIGASLEALGNAESRPLGSAALALTGSAAALNTAAGALGLAAAASGVGGGRGGRGFFRGVAGLAGGAFRTVRRFSPLGAAAAGLGIRPTADGTITDEQREISKLVAALPGVEQALIDLQFEIGTAQSRGQNILAEELRRAMNTAGDRITDGQVVTPRDIAALAAAASDRAGTRQLQVDEAVLFGQQVQITDSFQRNVSRPPSGPTAAVSPEQQSFVASLIERNDALRDGGDALQVAATLPDDLAGVFDQGSVAFEQSAAVMAEAGEQIGPDVAAAIMEAAPQIGTSIGNAARTAIGDVNVNVNGRGTPGPATPAPAPSVGATTLE